MAYTKRMKRQTKRVRRAQSSRNRKPGYSKSRTFRIRSKGGANTAATTTAATTTAATTTAATAAQRFESLIAQLKTAYNNLLTATSDFIKAELSLDQAHTALFNDPKSSILVAKVTEADNEKLRLQDIRQIAVDKLSALLLEARTTSSTIQGGPEKLSKIVDEYEDRVQKMYSDGAEKLYTLGENVGDTVSETVSETDTHRKLSRQMSSEFADSSIESAVRSLAATNPGNDGKDFLAINETYHKYLSANVSNQEYSVRIKKMIDMLLGESPKVTTREQLQVICLIICMMMRRIYYRIPVGERGNLELIMPNIKHVITVDRLKRNILLIRQVLEEIEKATTIEQIFNHLKKILIICNNNMESKTPRIAGRQ